MTTVCIFKFIFFSFLTDKFHSRLLDVPSDGILESLTEKNLIGDCVVHLGVELGLSIGEIRDTMYNFPRKLNLQIYDLLVKWKNRNVINRGKPTIYRLMVALLGVKAAAALVYIKKIYDVE